MWLAELNQWLPNHFPDDLQGNTVIGSSVGHEALNNIVYSKDRLTALVGVKDLVVVQAEGVTLVCAKDKVQDIKKLVEQLRKTGKYTEIL